MKPIKFKGQTAVITGAASGMGLVASRALTRLGATVVMCDIDAKALKAHVADINAARTKTAGTAVACVTDVRRHEDAEKAAKLALAKTGRIDLLICFAGGWEPRMCKSFMPFYEQPYEVLDWGLDVNLKGPVYFARACMPAMMRQQHGVMCFLGSITGFEGCGEGAMYGTAKSGLFNFVKGLSQAGAANGVRAFCVSPGPVMTRPGADNLNTLIPRAASPEEVVDFILYLMSENGSYVTGSNHVIDGGRLSMQPPKKPDVFRKLAEGGHAGRVTLP